MTVEGLLTHFLQSHGSSFYVARCNPATVPVLYRCDTDRIMCLGCKVCGKQTIHLMDQYEKHSASVHPWSNCMATRNFCCVAGCSFAFNEEVAFYQHLASEHQSVEITLNDCGNVSIVKKNEPTGAGQTLLGRRFECCFCKQIFFDHAAIRRHISQNEKLKTPSSLFRAQQQEAVIKKAAVAALPEVVVLHLLRSGIVRRKWHLLTSLRTRKLNERSGDGRVVLSEFQCSLGRRILITERTPHSQLNPDEICIRCEDRLGVALPTGVCFVRKQPIVLLSKAEVSDSTLQFALKSMKPRSHKLHVAQASDSLSDGKWNRQYRLWHKAPREEVMCHQCCMLYEVRVPKSMCVHKRFVLVSLARNNGERRSLRRIDPGWQQ